MNWQFLNKIWKPDTFFVNGKKSKIHKITVPNKFLRITPDGKVSYSQRLTIHARCRMHLFKFPFDSQLCPLWIGSYGYASKDVIFQWRHTGAISIGELQTAQFLITKVENGVINNTTMRLIESGFRNDSVAWIHFSLERQSGFFLLQVLKKSSNYYF
jgi:gamma-aminobutyric acid receptor subunit alpha